MHCVAFSLFCLGWGWMIRLIVCMFVVFFHLRLPSKCPRSFIIFKINQFLNGKKLRYFLRKRGRIRHSTCIAGSSAAAPPSNTCSTLISGCTLLSIPPDTHNPVSVEVHEKITISLCNMTKILNIFN